VARLCAGGDPGAHDTPGVKLALLGSRCGSFGDDGIESCPTASEHDVTAFYQVTTERSGKPFTSFANFSVVCGITRMATVPYASYH
jgi:hypothetical protein